MDNTKLKELLYLVYFEEQPFCYVCMSKHPKASIIDLSRDNPVI